MRCRLNSQVSWSHRFPELSTDNGYIAYILQNPHADIAEAMYKHINIFCSPEILQQRFGWLEVEDDCWLA